MEKRERRRKKQKNKERRPARSSVQILLFSPILLFPLSPFCTSSDSFGLCDIIVSSLFPSYHPYLIPPISQGIPGRHHGNHTIEPVPCNARRVRKAPCLRKKEFPYFLFAHKDITYLKIVLRGKIARHGFRSMYISKRSLVVCILYLVVNFYRVRGGDKHGKGTEIHGFVQPGRGC